MTLNKKKESVQPVDERAKEFPEAKAIPSVPATEIIATAVSVAPAEPVVAQPQPIQQQHRGQQLISVQVPEGCGPYDLIRVPLGNNGEQVDVQLLDGHTEGMTFQVAIDQPHNTMQGAVPMMQSIPLEGGEGPPPPRSGGSKRTNDRCS